MNKNNQDHPKDKEEKCVKILNAIDLRTIKENTMDTVSNVSDSKIK